MGRRRRAKALLAALAILALTVAAAIILWRLDRTRVAERLTDDAQAAGLRASDGVRTLTGTLEAQVQNGTANPRLVAALDAKVDEETLRDLLYTEPWWEPFRQSVDGFGVYSDETAAVVTSRLPARFEARSRPRRKTLAPYVKWAAGGRGAGHGRRRGAGGAHQSNWTGRSWWRERGR